MDFERFKKFVDERRNYREMRAAGICSYQARSIIFTTLIAGHYSSESR